MNYLKIYLKGSVICPFLVLVFFVACSPKVKEKTFNGDALGTTYTISYIDRGFNIEQQQIDSVFEWMNHSLSTYQENSLISAFNANSRDLWQDTSQIKYFMSDMFHFVNVLSISTHIHQATEGAFDPSAAAVFNLWAKAKSDNQLPDSIALENARSHQGLLDLEVDRNGFPKKVDSAFQLNFNAIAKGYTVDVIADFLSEHNITDFMVEVGGEVRCKGKNMQNKAWTIGINTPTINSSSTALFETISLQDQSMATSGNYRNYFEYNGKILGHTIDPRTGQPIINELKSATIIHNFCAEADAYATACMVLGYNASKEMIESDTTISGYLIYEKDGELIGEHID